MTNSTHPLWQLVSLTRRTLDSSPQLTRRQALRAAVNYLDRAECAAAELAGEALGITCGCDACEALTPETVERLEAEGDAEERLDADYREQVRADHRDVLAALRRDVAFTPCEPGGESPLDRAMRDA